MSVQTGLDAIAGFVKGIVDKKPYPDPAIGGLHHVINDDATGRIAVPHVILHVEASFSQVGERQTHDEGLATMAQQTESGQPRGVIACWNEELAEPGRREILKRRRNRARIARPDAGGLSGEESSQTHPEQQEAIRQQRSHDLVRQYRVSTSFVAVLVSEIRPALRMVAGPVAARTGAAIRSSLSGHRDSASPGRGTKCAMVSLGLFKIA